MEDCFICKIKFDKFKPYHNPINCLARKYEKTGLNEMGLKKKPYIKTSLSPGCGNITKHYLTKSGMLSYLEAFGFIFF